MILAYQYAKLKDMNALQGTLGLSFGLLYFLVACWKTNKVMTGTFSDNELSTADLSVIQWIELESEVFIF